MLKTIIHRASVSFIYGIALSFIITMIIMIVFSGGSGYPVVKEFAVKFPSDSAAYLLQILLMGAISAVFAGCSVIYEQIRWSFLKQGIIYFFITTCVWFPLVVYCFSLFNYPQSLLSTFITFTVTYVVIWLVQYTNCKKDIKDINAKLLEINQNN